MRIICIGAHPDDCEIAFGGTAAKFAELGHAVKFLALTNGDAGHAVQSGAVLAARRAAEIREASGRLGIAESEALPNHDGELLPTVELRHEMVRQIRRWEADIVLTHRPYDYHPDHRYAGQLVQDSAYLVVVPNVCRDVPALRANPVYLYLEDGFRKPVPFSPDVVVDIDPVWDRKVDALDAHVSQFYEWLPWVDGEQDEVPADPSGRREWLGARWSKPVSCCVRAALARRYGPREAEQIVHAESFELCEYGRRASAEELERIFPR